MDCDVLDTIENGYIEYSDGTVYQSVATYNCHSGHLLTVTVSATRHCGSIGTWNGTAPTCNSESKLDYIGISLLVLILYLLQECVKFTLTPSFNGETIHLITYCIIICTVINCGNLPMITNGEVDTSGGTNYKCTAVYTCDTGYVLNGNITRTCQEDANWSGNEPTCDSMWIAEMITLQTIGAIDI